MKKVWIIANLVLGIISLTMFVIVGHFGYLIAGLAFQALALFLAIRMED